MLDLEAGVSGRADLQRQLDALKQKVTASQLEKALVAGATVLQKSIEDHTPVRVATVSGDALFPGALKEDIIITVFPGTKYSMHVTAGPSAKTRRIMRLLEFGHRVATAIASRYGARKTAQGSTKFVPAYPVMRPAYEASKDEAMRTVITSLQEQSRS